MQKERPILFSAPMVRAILDGSKTQTRRIIKNQNLIGAPPHGFHAYEVEDSDGNRFWGFSSDDDDWKCPFGKPGDRLWVREKWNAMPVGEDGEAGYPYFTIPKEKPCGACIAYAADGEDGPFRPSIHMPRWASRITLEIVSVRVERLQEISNNDAISEGIVCVWRGDNGPHEFDQVPHFRFLWESINGKGSWDKNPWVWVIGFRRIEA